MLILLSNDDGYKAKGLRLLSRALSKIAEIVVVAPDRNRSGASNSLTLDAPLRVEQIDSNVYSVNGTPADCVHIAITGLLDVEPDMVISGINHGANLGDDVLYSGTVAAAMEGRFLNLPSIAVSHVADSESNLDAAVTIVEKIVHGVIENPLPSKTVLNVNVPDLALESIQGLQVTRLGRRYRSDPVVLAQDPKDRPVYWIGPAGKGEDIDLGTDFYAVTNDYVSVTPIAIDMTNHSGLNSLETWMKQLK